MERENLTNNTMPVPKDIIKEVLFGDPAYVDNDLYMKVMQIGFPMFMAKYGPVGNPKDDEDKQELIDRVYEELKHL